MKDLHKTCDHLASCLPDTKFIKTKKGGFFEKGNRKIGVVLKSQNSNSNFEKNFKINKWKKGYGINIHPMYKCSYTAIRESVCKGLGIKD